MTKNNNESKFTFAALRHIASKLDELDVPQEMRYATLGPSEAIELVRWLLAEKAISFTDDEMDEFLNGGEAFVLKHFSGLQGYSVDIQFDFGMEDVA